MKSWSLLILAATLLLLPKLHADADSDDAATAATAIEVSGTVVYEVSEGQFAPVTVGQLFAEGDHIETKDNSGLHLVMADGSSVILGANSEITLDKLGNGDEGSQTFLQLLKGSANAIVQKLKTGSAFEMSSPNSVAAVKGTDFELSDNGSSGSVTVREGLVSMGDAGRVNVVDVGPYQRSSVGVGIALHPMPLSQDEIRVFNDRWAHAHDMHLHRLVIMHRFAGSYRARLGALRHRGPVLRRFRSREAPRLARFRQIRAHHPMRPGGPAHPRSKGEMQRHSHPMMAAHRGHQSQPKRRREEEHHHN
jgi:ferric-dicitrate binding protein FerR (iron transport regulator)